MDMGVRYFKACDHEANPSAGNAGLLGLGNMVSNGHEVANGCSVQIGPLVDFGLGDDQDVAWVQGSNIQHDNTGFVIPDESTRNLATNDAGENRRHGCRR